MTNEIKFACPSCGQHIQGDVAYVGRKITCPMCHAQICVPRSSPAQTDGQLPKADLIATPPNTQQPGLARAEDPKPVAPKIAATTEPSTLDEKTAAGGAGSTGSEARVPNAPQTAGAVSEPKRGMPMKAAAGPGPDVHLLCPVCQSELSVPPGVPPAAASKPVPRAILIRRSGLATVAAVARSENKSGERDEGKSGARGASIEERTSRSGTIKPRLSYILTGEQPKPAEGSSPESRQR